MKKLFQFILPLILIGILNSCKDDNIHWDNTEVDPSGPVSLNLNVLIPDAPVFQTRSALDDAAGENTAGYLHKFVPYLFIFEDTGNPESNYLRTLVHGDAITMGEETQHGSESDHGVNLYLQNFSARVDGTAEDAIIHLVLIHPDDTENFEIQLQAMTDRSEIGMFSGANGLYSTMASYWKRIVLNKPINNSAESRAVLQDKLSHIKMVRNFAQVTVDVEDYVNDFIIEGFILVNPLDCGYVAAYNESTGTDFDNFVEFENNGTPAGYGHLSKDVNYIPVRHPQANRDNKDNESDWVNGIVWNNKAKYTFERPVETSHRTFVVIKAVNQGLTEYFKLDIGGYDTDQADAIGQPYGVFELYHLIRNISFNIHITDVNGHGYADAATAISSITSNNISASVDTENVMGIGDGVDYISMHIWNNYDPTLRKENDGTTIVIVDDKDGKPYPASVDLEWQYTTEENGTETILNDQVKHDYPGYDLKEDGIILSFPEWTNNTPGYQGYTINFNPPGDIPQQKTVKFYKPNGLSRDITFVLRKRWEFVNDYKESDPAEYKSDIEVFPGYYAYDADYQTMEVPGNTLNEVHEVIKDEDGLNNPGKIGSHRGAQLTVMFELPGDIPRSLFPLEFKIGFDRQNIENAYVGNAVVVYGESMFEDDLGGIGVPRMQFVKTVDWEYYNGSGDPGDKGHKIVTARFRTTTDVLGSMETDDDTKETSSTRVRVTNPYFELGEGKFQRKVKENDPDGFRTVWSWYFDDPGWTDYFNRVEDASHAAQGSYNELTYNPHTWASTKYGLYMGFDKNSSETNWDFQFSPDVTIPAADGNDYTASLIISAACKTFSRSILIFGTRYYRRRSIVKIEIMDKDGTLRTVSIDKTNKPDAFRFDAQGQMPEIRTETFDLNPGDTIQKITIWSSSYKDDDNNEDEYIETRYYSIRLQLDPKK